MRPEDLLCSTPAGLFSKAGGLHIDPTRPVERALITHGHSDHARSGHGAVLATRETLRIMAARYGEDFAGTTEAATLGEAMRIGDATVTFQPAGHVLGSAQIVVESGGTRIVASGDYKRRPDPTCQSFEPVACDVFITEATFGLPVFRHPPDSEEIAKLLTAQAQFPERAVLVGAYALGKAQRVIALLRQAGYERPIWIHGALQGLCDLYRDFGVELGELRPATGAAKKDLAGEIVLAPPGSLTDRWSRRLPDPITAMASGWMRVRARARQRGAELPLIISDHADWDELTMTIREVAAPEVWVTHGNEEALVHYARTIGLRGRALALIGRGEDEQEAPGGEETQEAEA